MKRASVSAISLAFIFAFIFSASAEPVGPQDAMIVGQVHLRAQEQLWRNKPSLATQAVLEGQKYSISEARELRTDDQVIAYILDLSPEGCIVVSPDTDIYPVIAYSFKGRFSMEDAPGNVLLYLLKQDMENRLTALPMTSERLKARNNDLWESYLAQEETFIQQLSSDQVWGPWLQTTWQQGWPYNRYCPIDPGTRQRSIVGCVATAMAQIVNYWNHPSQLSFGDGDKYVSSGGIRIDDDHEAFDFPSFAQLNQMLSDIRYDGDQYEIAALCFACGISLRMGYTSASSSPSGGLGSWQYKTKFKYASAQIKYGDEEDFYDVLCENMKTEQPVHLNILAPTSGHSIVADGFRDVWTGQPGDFYHLNFGWGAGSPNPIDQCWYTLPEGMPGGYNAVSYGIVDIYPAPKDISNRTIHVDTTGDDTTGDGTEDFPYRTIQKGIDAAIYGDTVLVADGMYTGPGNVGLDFHGKAITVKSQNGPANCIINCEGNARGFNLHSGEIWSSVVDGFSILNGEAGWGGGIACSNSSPRILNNIVVGNSATFGGGIYCGHSYAIVAGNTIMGNRASFGGGIYCINSSVPTVINNIIAHNSAHAGGGICSDYCPPVLINNTITGNIANHGGGLHLLKCQHSYPAQMTVINTILWDNEPQEISFGSTGHPNTVTIRYSDIQGGLAGIVTYDNGTVDWGEGNMDSHPLFADVANGDYHLSDYSPCIGAGTINDAPVMDLDGDQRPDPDGSDPDIGAYESPLGEPLPRTICVATTGDDVDGDGWETNPYRTIQKGIDESINGGIVVVKDGMYTGQGNVNLDFQGKAITVRSENGPANCAIDCEEAEGTRGFYFHNSEGADSVIQGFTIRNGRADRGGGIFCGGSPTITENVIAGNVAAQQGGGIYCVGSSSLIARNTITGNRSEDEGGGICCYDMCNPTIANNVIAGNSAGEEGGGISWSDVSSPTIVNNTITGNSAPVGGGLYCWNESSSTITNTILWNDGADEIFVDSACQVTISYSDVQGGQAGIGGSGTANWGEGNMDTQPLFVDMTSGDYHLSDYSPCIGAGASTGAPIMDIEGRTRPDPAGSKPDMGAYENSLDKPGSITLTSPNGGEVWRGGSSQNITWDSPGPDGHYISLLYSADGGNTYSETIIPSADDDGVYEWNPVASLDSATVRVQAIVEFEGVAEAASDTSDGNFMIDSTAPETSISSLTGTKGKNEWYQSDVEIELSATDNLSGISQITYRENQGAWQPYPEQGVTVTSSTIVYYRSQDNAGNLEAENSIEIKIDKTSPPKPVVTDDGIYTSSTTQLHAWWMSDDPESGIQKYEYAVGTAPGEDDVVEWTSEGIGMGGSSSVDGMPDGITLDGTNVIDWASVDGEVTVTDLSLIDGQIYYFSVKAENNAGLWSNMGISDGITVNASLEQRDIRLYAGMNLISICLDTEDTGISSVLEPIQGLYTVVWSYDAAWGGWRWYVPEGDPLFNVLNTMEFGKAYCINMVEGATLTITGRQIADTAIQLLQGWNLAGYNSTKPQPRDAALSTVADNCICVWAYNNHTGSWSRYIPTIPHAFSDLVDFVPDRGYWICVDKSCEWRISP